MSSFKLHFHISNRLLRDERSKFSRPIVNLSIIGVALGLIIMILSVSITGGYKNEIRNKVIAMGSHIRISNYDMNYSFEPSPISRTQFFMEDLKKNPNIQSVQYYCTKVGIVKTDDQVEGVVLKGIDTSFLWDNFARNIVEGTKIEVKGEEAGRDILISRYLAQKLRLKVGDKVRTYFVQNPPMQRSFVVTGIYETGMPEFDKKFALVDLRHVQKLNNWDSLTVGGIEILIRDYDRLEEIGKEINGMIGYQLKAETIRQIYPEIFEWIDLFDTNVIVLMLITVFVCIITMISTFFIIVLEQTQTIGILKSLGMKTKGILNIFLLLASKIMIKGLLLGNVVAILLCLAQKYFHFIKLDATTYYVPYVPIAFNIPFIIAINIGVLFVCILVLALPAYYVAKKISPVNAIRFE